MLFAIIAIIVIIIDQYTKYYVQSHMTLGESIPVIENIFHWTYILNDGAAFGMFAGARYIFIAIAFAVILGIYFFREDIKELGPWATYGTCLFAGGAVGNLIDRAKTGVVVDFFDFRVWPVFNVADIAICVGVGMLVWSTLKTDLWKTEKN